MTNQIIPTLKYCIGPIQLKLSGSGVDGPIFEKALAKRFQGTKIPRNVNNSLNLPVDNHFKNMSKRYAHTVSQKMLINRNIGKETQ